MCHRQEDLLPAPSFYFFLPYFASLFPLSFVFYSLLSLLFQNSPCLGKREDETKAIHIELSSLELSRPLGHEKAVTVGKHR